MGNDLSLRALLSATKLPSNEAKILLAHVLEVHYQLPRSALLARDDMALSANALSQWKNLESRRLEGEPIAYLIGKKGFYNIDLFVAPGVLIPRPETEILVELGLREIERLQKLTASPIKVLDLGTGSGAIALAIAHSAKNVSVVATDQSPEALDIAKRNCQNLLLEDRVNFFQGNWYEAIQPKKSFDIILSNPPYIANADPHLIDGDLRFEPLSALTDHGSGLTCLKTIIFGAAEHLSPNGLIAVEHGFNQSAEVEQLMIEAGLTEVLIIKDLANHQRVVSARKIR